MRGQGPDRLRAERVHGVFAVTRRGAGVHLVHDQHVEGPRVLRSYRQHLTQEAHRALALEPVDADDQPGVVGPRVRVQAAGPPQVPQHLSVDDAEVQAELVAHLVMPLQREPGRADDQHRPGPVTQHQLLHDQPGFDGLTEPNIVGNQQVGPRHRQRPHHRVELVILDLDTGTERGLQNGLIR